MTSPLKRILTDAAGYGLILLGIATGWLPGPGGIPLILGGLGLLSIHNMWARRLRDWLIGHGEELLRRLFPPHPRIQAAYDILAVLLLAAAVYLSWNHAAIWQISLAIVVFIATILIAGMNRGRFTRAKRVMRRPSGS